MSILLRTGHSLEAGCDCGPPRPQPQPPQPPPPPPPPGPTEIECIEVAKVFDLCFQPETLNNTFTFTPSTTPSLRCFCPTGTATACPIGTIIPCMLGTPTCTETSRTPTGTDGFASVTLVISVPVLLFPVGTTPSPMVTPCVTETFMFTKRVTLCAPAGTTTVCSVTGTCDAMITAETTAGASGNLTSITIAVSLDLCVVVKTVADVNLLVPAFGFCVPSECTTFGLACPPGPPPQCVLTAG